MAFTQVSAPATPISAPSFYARVQTFFARRAMYRRTLRELQSLSDRELADIGLARSQIRAVSLSSMDVV